MAVKAEMLSPKNEPIPARAIIMTKSWMKTRLKNKNARIIRNEINVAQFVPKKLLNASWLPPKVASAKVVLKNIVLNLLLRRATHTKRKPNIAKNANSAHENLIWLAGKGKTPGCFITQLAEYKPRS